MVPAEGPFCSSGVPSRSMATERWALHVVSPGAKWEEYRNNTEFGVAQGSQPGPREFLFLPSASAL